MKVKCVLQAAISSYVTCFTSFTAEAMRYIIVSNEKWSKINHSIFQKYIFTLFKREEDMSDVSKYSDIQVFDNLKATF